MLILRLFFCGQDFFEVSCFFFWGGGLVLGFQVNF